LRPRGYLMLEEEKGDKKIMPETQNTKNLHRVCLEKRTNLC
jgi:hypothetical protein